MNPYDNVGTTRLSTTVHDRLCRLAIDYQDAAAERRVVALRTGRRRARVVADAVAVTRATREHPDVRQGCSVRGAIDLALVAGQLASWVSSVGCPWTLHGPPGYPELVYDAMMSRCPAGSSSTRRSETRRRRCCGRSGRTTSSWPRLRRRLVEEKSPPTRRAGAWRAEGSSPRRH